MRSLPWLGAYGLAVIAPLAIAAFRDPITAERPYAVELAAALGFVAFAVIAVEFALVSRLRVVSRPFGNDALMRFHRALGLAAALFALAHAIVSAARVSTWSSFDPFSGTFGSRSGAIALWSLTVLVVTSLVRRRARIRYELWQRLHRGLALTAVFALLVHVLALGSYAHAALVAGVCCAYVAVFVALMFHYRIVRRWRAARRPWEIAANRDEGGDTRTLVLQPVDHDGLAFEPGQFVWLGTSTGPFGAEEHPISIASSSEARARIELSIKALGDWSRDVVPQLLPGRRVWLDGPFGAFTLERAAAGPLVLIAGGIGVTPLRSMLLSLRDRGDTRPVTLFLAAHDRSRALFVPEFEALVSQMPLRFVGVYEDDPDARAEHGFVTADVLRRHLPDELKRSDYFVCGPIPMIDAVERALAELGVDARRIHTERFDSV